MHKLLIALMTAVFAVSPVYAASHTKDEKKAEAKKAETKQEEMKDEKKTEAKKEETKKKKPKGGC
jgi:ribosomal protein L12E/L44/L45/RPP1/RPP2